MVGNTQRLCITRNNRADIYYAMHASIELIAESVVLINGIILLTAIEGSGEIAPWRRQIQDSVVDCHPANFAIEGRQIPHFLLNLECHVMEMRHTA